MKRFQYEAAVDRSGLPGVQRAVLRHVVRRAVTQGGELGEAWPSIADVASCTGFGKATAKRALRDLLASGWLRVVGHRGQVRMFVCEVGRHPTPGSERARSGVRARPVSERPQTGVRATPGSIP